MKHPFILICILLISGQSLVAQNQLPLIKATSKDVDIRDGDTLKKNAWIIVPEAKPDRYITNTKNKKVTFYTNLDSISFTVEPGKKYDFIILLNDKDTALTEILYQPSYLETLKQAGKYNPDDKRELPKFTYQSSDDLHLVALRKAFNLDSVAGEGNEVSKILSLMHWVHNIVPHDGTKGNPQIMNAMNMIEVCKKEKRGLNCRGMAMVMNECYLSMGFKSRFITCLPKDSLHIDTDCHVINMVYSQELKKWLWIDPTFDAYVMNEKGELLSIEEVRERIINDKPLILNPEANWNHKTSQTQDYYLYNYMAKNLYLLECPLRSEYDAETAQEGKVTGYMQLIPLDYFNKSLEKNESINDATGIKWETYKTNNSSVFWEIP